MKKIAFLLAFLGLGLFSSTKIYAQAQFNENILFPVSTEEAQDETPEGEEKTSGKFEIVGVIIEKKTILEFIPNLINLLLKFVSPVIFAMFVYSGLKFIYAQDNEEQLNESKKFFLYASVGLIFIVLSYSLMKAIYYVLAS